MACYGRSRFALFYFARAFLPSSDDVKLAWQSLLPLFVADRPTPSSVRASSTFRHHGSDGRIVVLSFGYGVVIRLSLGAMSRLVPLHPSAVHGFPGPSKNR